jgi:hypothetical protein
MSLDERGTGIPAARSRGLMMATYQVGVAVVLAQGVKFDLA